MDKVRRGAIPLLSSEPARTALAVYQNPSNGDYFITELDRLDIFSRDGKWLGKVTMAFKTMNGDLGYTQGNTLYAFPSTSMGGNYDGTILNRADRKKLGSMSFRTAKTSEILDFLRKKQLQGIDPSDFLPPFGLKHPCEAILGAGK